MRGRRLSWHKLYEISYPWAKLKDIFRDLDDWFRLFWAHVIEWNSGTLLTSFTSLENNIIIKNQFPSVRTAFQEG
jgi:hypothetical protein